MGQGKCPNCSEHLEWESTPYAAFRALSSHLRVCKGGENKQIRIRQTPLFKLAEEDERELDILERLESVFVPTLKDALRPDILDNDERGNPRTEQQKEDLRTIWRRVRIILIPHLQYFEDTPAQMLRSTTWMMVTGGTGKGKSLTGCYLTEWLLATNSWIQYIYSNTPIYAGSCFHYKFPLRCGGECESCQNELTCDGNCRTCRLPIDDAAKTHVGHRLTYPGHRLLHPKYRPIIKLRDISNYKNAIVFMDEVGSIMPSRGFMSRLQWVIAMMAKNFRRHNCYVIMTEQVPDNLDRQLRANLRWIIDPEIVFFDNQFQFAMHPNFNAELSQYIAKTRMGYGPEPQRYPTYPTWEVPTPDFPAPPMPWLVTFYDTMSEVEILFQDALEGQRVSDAVEEIWQWIQKTDQAGVWTGYYSKDEYPSESKVKQLIDGWNLVFGKHYVEDELLLIFFEFLRIHQPVKEKEEKTYDRPQCDICKNADGSPMSFGSKFQYDNHIQGKPHAKQKARLQEAFASEVSEDPLVNRMMNAAKRGASESDIQKMINEAPKEAQEAAVRAVSEAGKKVFKKKDSNT